jgi:hypothetical protein
MRAVHGCPVPGKSEATERRIGLAPIGLIATVLDSAALRTKQRSAPHPLTGVLKHYLECVKEVLRRCSTQNVYVRLSATSAGTHTARRIAESDLVQSWGEKNSRI